MRHMANLMRDDAGEFIGVFGLLDQPFENIDMPAGQRDRVGFAAADDLRFERNGKRGNRLQLS